MYAYYPAAAESSSAPPVMALSNEQKQRNDAVVVARLEEMMAGSSASSNEANPITCINHAGWSADKSVDEIIKELTEFRDAREWEQFHNPKDLALALNIEAGELLENYLWKESSEADVEKVRLEVK